MIYTCCYFYVRQTPKQRRKCRSRCPSRYRTNCLKHTQKRNISPLAEQEQKQQQQRTTHKQKQGQVEFTAKVLAANVRTDAQKLALSEKCLQGLSLWALPVAASMYETNAEAKAEMQKQRPKQRQRTRQKQKKMQTHDATSVNNHVWEVCFFV